VLDHSKYVALGDQEYVKRLEIPAKRGVIYAMDGLEPVPLVMNQTVYTVFADPQEVTEPKKVKKVIKEVAGGDLKVDLDKALGDQKSRYKVLVVGANLKQAKLIKKAKLAGIGLQETMRRVYPEGSLASQTLGFVNNDGEGQYGVEGALDERLAGKNGLLQSVTDVSSVPLTIGSKNIDQPAVPGDNIVLTIDRNVQAQLEKSIKAGAERIGASRVSAVVMNPQNGQVMAMASLPSYNQAKYTSVKNAGLFLNPITADPYEPGSVIKTFIMSTGLDTGVITPGSTYYNTDSIKIGDRTIKNAFKGLIGNISMQTVLNHSLNTGAVTVAERLGGGSINRKARDTMYKYYHDRFGFGKKTGIEQYEEQGMLLSPSDADGNAVRYSNMAFGQGMNITMIQVAAGFSAAINGGNYYQPTLVAGTMVGDEFKKATEIEPKQRSVVKNTTSTTLRKMLITARGSIHSIYDKKGYTVGGKTGTSETLSGGSYIDSVTTGSYLGFGGDTVPRYVIMVRVEGDGKNLEGGIHAQPIFAEMSNWLLGYLNVKARK
jgi:cell division protein FtsI/penicillin-binding protein 2